MPNAIVKSYAKETGKSEEHIERWWKEAEAEALEKFGKKSDPRFYAYVNGIVEKRGKLVHGKRKKRGKTNEEVAMTESFDPRKMTFKTFVEPFEIEEE